MHRDWEGVRQDIHTINLYLEPAECCPRKLLLRRSVLESVGNMDIREIFQNGTLHSQLVEISIQEGYDSFGER